LRFLPPVRPGAEKCRAASPRGLKVVLPPAPRDCPMPCRRQKRQGRIGQHRAGGRDLLMDSHEIPLAGGEQLQICCRRVGFLARCTPAPGGIRTEDSAHRLARDAQHPRDLTFAHALGVQFQNRGPLGWLNIGSSSWDALPKRSVMRRCSICPAPLALWAVHFHGADARQSPLGG